MEKALERQRVQGGRLGTHLVGLGLVGEEDVARALSIQHRVPPFLPSWTPANPEARERVPLEMAKRLGVFPVDWDGAKGVLGLAAADPDDLAALDEVRFASGARRVAVMASPETTIERLIAEHYQGIVPEQTAAPKVVEDEPAPEAAPERRPRRASSRAIVADPDPRRRRGVSALAEAAGHRVEKIGTLEELRRAMARPGWAAAWVHRSWAAEAGGPGVTAYDDPLHAAAEQEAGSRLAAEAAALGEEAARAALGPGFERARQAVNLVRFLARRQGISGCALECLDLATWRSALAGWQAVDRAVPLPGEETLRAVAAYETALQGGASPAAAAESVRRRPELDPDAVTGLLRWVEGADLLGRVGSLRMLALFPEDLSPGPLLERIAQAGWTVERAPRAPDPTPACDAVLAAMEPGLELLDALSRAPEGARPPVFLVAQAESNPETMYALRLGAEDVFGPDTHPEVAAAKIERAAGRGAVSRSAVSGNLRDMGFADIVQILAHGMKTAVIRLEGPRGSGEVALREGAIVDARIGSREGPDAFYDIMDWEEGGFRIEPDAAPAAETIQGNTEGLLMEGFRRMDERRRGPSEGVPEL